MPGAHSRAARQSHSAWSDYGGRLDSSQDSALREINRTNVNKLKIAWVFRSDDENRYFFNPIGVHALAYVLAENNSIVALNAETGIVSYGTNGRVDLKEGLGRDPRTLLLVQSTTPGRVFESLLILGSATNQGPKGGCGCAV